MDAHEDYVWPRATSELMLLPVTGLECVGDRLLAGEVWCALAEKKPGALRGRDRQDKGMPARRRTGGGMKPDRGGREPRRWRAGGPAGGAQKTKKTTTMWLSSSFATCS